MATAVSYPLSLTNGSSETFPRFQVCSGHLVLEPLDESVVPFLPRVEVYHDTMILIGMLILFSEKQA